MQLHESLFGQQRRQSDQQEEFKSLYELYTERRKGPAPSYADKKVDSFVRGSKFGEALCKSDMYSWISKHQQTNTSPSGYVSVLSQQLNELDGLLDTIMKPAEKHIVEEKLGGMGDNLKQLQSKLEVNEASKRMSMVSHTQYLPQRDRRYSIQPKTLIGTMSHSIISEMH